MATDRPNDGTDCLTMLCACALQCNHQWLAESSKRRCSNLVTYSSTASHKMDGRWDHATSIPSMLPGYCLGTLYVLRDPLIDTFSLLDSTCSLTILSVEIY